MPQVYGPNIIVYCNKCSKISTSTDVIYHCDQMNNIIHPNGYDLCFPCYCNDHQSLNKSESQDDHISSLLCTDSTHKSIATLFCDAFIEKCEYLHVLRNVMKKYKSCQIHDNIECKDLNYMFNAYLHLLHNHDNGNDFEYITNQFESCDVFECSGYGRNHRDRSQHDCNHLPSTSIDILDTIHCYFKHSYDMGYRLTTKEMSQITKQGEYKMNDEEIQPFVNTSSKKLIQFLTNKEKISTKKIQNYNERSKHKMSIYSFGEQIIYDYEGETNTIAGWPLRPNRKYSSLKEEMTSNKLCILNMKQFNHEYKKAKIYYNSVHCKHKFLTTNFVEILPNGTKIKWKFSLELVLSLMFYCNYTNLQGQFCKTYRETANHEEYYNFGKNLKIAVHKFGSKMINGEVNTFYRGVGEILLLDNIANNIENSIQIRVPLSTSSSLEVAINFTNHKNGMILYFEAGQSGKCKYFSTAWLSDFAGEREYLFIQNQYEFEIKNILDVSLGIEYELIMDGIKYINLLTSEIINRINLDKWKENISDTLMNVIIAITNHRLSTTNNRFKEFKSLSDYGKQMVNKYFENRGSSLYINYDVMKRQGHLPLFDMFCTEQYEWINLKNISVLFPNSKSGYIYINNLEYTIFQDLLEFFSTISSCKLSRATITWKVNKLKIANEKIPYNSWLKLGDLHRIGFRTSIQRSERGGGLVVITRVGESVLGIRSSLDDYLKRYDYLDDGDCLYVCRMK
eukprot:237380_1